MRTRCQKLIGSVRNLDSPRFGRAYQDNLCHVGYLSCFCKKVEGAMRPERLIVNFASSKQIAMVSRRIPINEFPACFFFNRNRFHYNDFIPSNNYPHRRISLFGIHVIADDTQ